MDSKLQLLRNVPLFGACGPGSLQSIASLADEVDVAAGKVLIREGETGDAFYLIVDGTVRVERDGSGTRTLGPGEYFGEISLVDHGPRSATVTTETPARLLVIGHREFHSLLDQEPAIRTDVLSALARRVRELDPAATTH
jgi:CRP/FNR family transcriptional regulator, cyclic AMP receptor protein